MPKGYILGIDPSSKCTGVCLMDASGHVILVGSFGDGADTQEPVVDALLPHKNSIEMVVAEHTSTRMSLSCGKALGVLSRVYLEPWKVKTVTPQEWRLRAYGADILKKGKRPEGSAHHRTKAWKAMAMARCNELWPDMRFAWANDNIAEAAMMALAYSEAGHVVAPKRAKKAS